jgi:cation transport ATPase
MDKTGTLTLPEPRVDNAAALGPTCSSWRRGWRCRAGIRWLCAVAR